MLLKSQIQQVSSSMQYKINNQAVGRPLLHQCRLALFMLSNEANNK